MLNAIRISKSFNIGAQMLPVLRDVSLNVKQGEFASLMGPSGSGKEHTVIYPRRAGQSRFRQRCGKW